jgi:branched-chain amino acid transport system permease protein
LSALDNVQLGLGANRVTSSLAAGFGEAFGSRGAASRRTRAYDALDAVGLAALAERPAESLALGDQRRLEIARALVSEPRLILLDEPVAGVARDEEERLLALLRRLNEERGITMLVIEHNVRFVRQLCTTVSVMAAGRLVFEAPPEQAIAAPAVRALYFGEAHARAP